MSPMDNDTMIGKLYLSLNCYYDSKLQTQFFKYIICEELKIG